MKLNFYHYPILVLIVIALVTTSHVGEAGGCCEKMFNAAKCVASSSAEKVWSIMESLTSELVDLNVKPLIREARTLMNAARSRDTDRNDQHGENMQTRIFRSLMNVATEYSALLTNHVLPRINRLQLRLVEVLPNILLSFFIMRPMSVSVEDLGGAEPLKMHTYNLVERTTDDTPIHTKISYYYYKKKGANRVLLWSDGKDALVNHYATRKWLHSISERLNVSVLAWDYPGHGGSSPIPFDHMKTLKESLYQGIDSMVQVLTDVGFYRQQIILYGLVGIPIHDCLLVGRGCRCLGCLPSSWIASEFQFNSVFMISPILSFESVFNTHFRVHETIRVPASFDMALKTKFVGDIPVAIFRPNGDEFSNKRDLLRHWSSYPPKQLRFFVVKGTHNKYDRFTILELLRIFKQHNMDRVQVKKAPDAKRTHRRDWCSAEMLILEQTIRDKRLPKLVNKLLEALGCESPAVHSVVGCATCVTQCGYRAWFALFRNTNHCGRLEYRNPLNLTNRAKSSTEPFWHKVPADLANIIEKEQEQTWMDQAMGAVSRMTHSLQIIRSLLRHPNADNTAMLNVYLKAFRDSLRSLQRMTQLPSLVKGMVVTSLRGINRSLGNVDASVENVRAFKNQAMHEIQRLLQEL